ncbi:MAG TPA: hypothetical protein VFX03_05330, partial [Thermomicrobiales bacterium]|nr:hypothetical protein [Thermomicrobiales bacterium]
MVFRKDNKVDSFQRQISALRQQLGTDGEDDRSSGADDTRRGQAAGSDLPTFPTRDAAGYGLTGFGAGASS